MTKEQQLSKQLLSLGVQHDPKASLAILQGLLKQAMDEEETKRRNAAEKDAKGMTSTGTEKPEGASEAQNGDVKPNPTEQPTVPPGDKPEVKEPEEDENLVESRGNFQLFRKNSVNGKWEMRNLAGQLISKGDDLDEGKKLIADLNRNNPQGQS